MFPEDHVILNMNDIHDIINIMLTKILENFKLNTSLIIIFLFVLNYLDSNLLFSFMVNTPDGCSETTCPKVFTYLISVANMVSNHYFIITLVIIVAIIVIIYLFFFVIWGCFTLL